MEKKSKEPFLFWKGKKGKVYTNKIDLSFRGKNPTKSSEKTYVLRPRAKCLWIKFFLFLRTAALGIPSTKVQVALSVDVVDGGHPDPLGQRHSALKGNIV